MPAINHLIITIAESKLGNADAAASSFELAVEQWPEDLRHRGDYIVDAPEGVLWFETYEQLTRLRDEARQLQRPGRNDGQ